MHSSEDRKLYEAITSGNLQSVQELIAKGIDIYQWAYEEYDGNFDGFLNPLQKAVQLENLEIVQFLLQAKFETNLKQEYIYRSLEIAAILGNINMFQILFQFLDNNLDKDILNSLLEHAVLGGNKDIVQALIKANANLNLRKERGTPLMIAARKGDLNLVKLLVEAGADVDIISDESPFMGALGLAATSGHKEVFDYLFPFASNLEERKFAQKAITQ